MASIITRAPAAYADNGADDPSLPERSGRTDEDAAAEPGWAGRARRRAGLTTHKASVRTLAERPEVPLPAILWTGASLACGAPAAASRRGGVLGSPAKPGRNALNRCLFRRAAASPRRGLPIVEAPALHRVATSLAGDRIFAEATVSIVHGLKGEDPDRRADAIGEGH